MTTAWGNNDQGPGEDQSWLGGGDRGGQGDALGQNRSGARNGAGSSEDGWPSDFGEGGQGSEPPTYQGPEFGDRSGQDGSSRPEGDGSGWASSFTGANGSGRSGSGSQKSFLPMLLGGLASLVGVVIFAVIAYRMGMDIWWAVLFIGIPLISRVARLLRRNNRN